ncbi:hypothetical protein [Micromonospora sp. NPDC093277]|uniref:hypothetical protein n=1 Tax=Micromonospora sp. NPDC093277 TaxID=3364291 RepID=UPI00382F544F
MTYQQLFDDLIGDVPISTVDLDRVIGRERRVRRLRIGAGTTAVAAAVAAVAFGTTALIGKPHAQPAKPKPTITTVPGTDQDLDRIDAAVVAALLRAEPRLTWAAEGTLASTTPNWESQPSGGATLASGYLGEGGVRIGGVDVSVQVQIRRDGAASWEREGGTSCSKNADECGERSGPHGEKIKFERGSWERQVPPDLRDRLPRRSEKGRVAVLRRDGSLVLVNATTTGEDSRLPLTVEQLTTVALDQTIVLAPMPPPSPAPSSTVTTVAGTQQDAARLETALTAAFRKQAPGFTWTTKWGGKDSAGPVDDARTRLNVDEPSLGAWFRVGNRGGNVILRLVREGQAVWESAPPCPVAGPAGLSCTVTTGPGGERIRARQLLRGFGWAGDLHRPAADGSLLVEVLRPDNSLVYLSVGQDKPALSLAQLVDVALDPALVLAPPPPRGTVSGQGFGGPRQYYNEAELTAAGTALDAVSPEGTIFVSPSHAEFDGLNRTSAVSFVFLVQRAGLAGDGEIVVQRRMGFAVSCEMVRSISSQLHERHPHGGECTESTRPDGNRVVVIVSRSSGTVAYDVFVQRPDRGTVEVVLDNVPNSGAATDMPESQDLVHVWPKGVQGGTKPPLTLHQATELAGHPDLLNLLP